MPKLSTLKKSLYMQVRIPKPALWEFSCEIPISLAAVIEAWFDEVEQPWMLREDVLNKRVELLGYFHSREEGEEAFQKLGDNFENLPESVTIGLVQEEDWRESYKAHFHPWNHRHLHWVPVWKRDEYALPPQAHAIYLDPGMAFGTGNHETTRLCAQALVDLIETSDLLPRPLPQLRFVDAGCGSGILAISAAALGLGIAPNGWIKAFDIDPDAVEIAAANAAANQLAGAIEFTCEGLSEALAKVVGQVDVLLANILAPVLQQHADDLLRSLAPGGHLVLSGILKAEAQDLACFFSSSARQLWPQTREVTTATDGDWCSLTVVRPNTIDQGTK